MESQTHTSFPNNSHGSIILIVLVAVAICLLHFPTKAAGKEKSWHKIENSYFEAQSNASRKKTLELLTELENFRAAVLQVTKSRLPEDAPKTRVLIFGSNKEFSKYTWHRSIGGYAVSIEGGTLLVLPTTRQSSINENVIRHEYAHALLSYKEIRYPTWFSEGFAELVSTMTFRNKGTHFILGEPIGRVRYAGAALVDWELLISDDFDIHAISLTTERSNAYLQSWLLTHYLMLGNNFQNADNLQGYFYLLDSGVSSLEAFELAFGLTPSDWANRRMNVYIKTMTYVGYNFRPNSQDHHFVQSDVEQEDIEPTLTYLSAIASSHQKPESLKKSLSTLSGNWDQASIDGFCDQSDRFTLSPDQQTLTVEGELRFGANEDNGYASTFDSDGDGNFRPSGVDQFLLGKRVDPQEFLISIRANDTICLAPPGSSETICKAVFKKCPE